MRAVLTLPTPGHNLTLEDLRAALAPTTWLPSSKEAPWLSARTAALVAKFPDDLQEQLADAEFLLIQVGLSVEGLVSLERSNTVMIRLIHEGGDISEIKDAVRMIAATLPTTFQEVTMTDVLRLHKEIDIRQDNDGATVAKGEIVTPHQLEFVQYVKNDREREYTVFGALLMLFIGTLLGAICLEVFDPSWGAADALQGYAERISSALAVALLTMYINLRFEYREWRLEETEVRWLFG